MQYSQVCYVVAYRLTNIAAELHSDHEQPVSLARFFSHFDSEWASDAHHWQTIVCRTNIRTHGTVGLPVTNSVTVPAADRTRKYAVAI
jgi:hypothetical protein